jgi:hypothetical protein
LREGKINDLEGITVEVDFTAYGRNQQERFELLFLRRPGGKGEKLISFESFIYWRLPKCRK